MTPPNLQTWQIGKYISPKYKYSFKYPPTWTVIDAGPSEGTITEIYSWDGKRENGFEGRKIKKSEIDIEIYEINSNLSVKEWYATDKTQPMNKILSEEVVNINNMTGIKRLWEDDEGYRFMSVDLSNGKKIYRVFGLPMNTYSKEYEQIIQSFKQP